MPAGSTYTILTVGDGLVSQIPALIVSTAAGLLVTKGGTTGSTEKAVFGQLGGYPMAMALCSGLMVILALLPGIPKIPFIGIALLLAGGTYMMWRQTKVAEEEAAAEIQAQELLAPAGGADLLGAAYRPRPARARLRAADAR